MKKVTITKYIADDGTKFDTEEECLRHETMTKLLEPILELLKPLSTVHKRKREKFKLGLEYIQHSAEKVKKYRSNLTAMCKEFVNDEEARNGIIDMEYALSEYGPGELNSAYYRMTCIDDQNREWYQPRYANNNSKQPQS